MRWNSMVEATEMHSVNQSFNVWMIPTKRIQVNRDFDAHDGGVFLSEDGRRLWLKTGARTWQSW